MESLDTGRIDKAAGSTLAGLARCRDSRVSFAERRYEYATLFSLVYAPGGPCSVLRDGEAEEVLSRLASAFRLLAGI